MVQTSTAWHIENRLVVFVLFRHFFSGNNSDIVLGERNNVGDDRGTKCAAISFALPLVGTGFCTTKPTKIVESLSKRGYLIVHNEIEVPFR